MDGALTLDSFTLFIIAFAMFVILEIFFLFARTMEAEMSLHDLRVRSHTLKRQLVEAAAHELLEQRRSVTGSARRRTSPPTTRGLGETVSAKDVSPDEIAQVVGD